MIPASPERRPSGSFPPSSSPWIDWRARRLAASTRSSLVRGRRPTRGSPRAAPWPARRRRPCSRRSNRRLTQSLRPAHRQLQPRGGEWRSSNDGRTDDEGKGDGTRGDRRPGVRLGRARGDGRRDIGQRPPARHHAGGRDPRVRRRRLRERAGGQRPRPGRRRRGRRAGRPRQRHRLRRDGLRPARRGRRRRRRVGGLGRRCRLRRRRARTSSTAARGTTRSAADPATIVSGPARDTTSSTAAPATTRCTRSRPTATADTLDCGPGRDTARVLASERSDHDVPRLRDRHGRGRRRARTTRPRRATATPTRTEGGGAGPRPRPSALVHHPGTIPSPSVAPVPAADHHHLRRKWRTS